MLQSSQAESQLLTTEGISLIPCARNILAAQFLASAAEYLLCIDADLVFPCADPVLLAQSLEVDLGLLPQDIQERLALNSLDQLLRREKLVIGADYLRKSQLQRDQNRASSSSSFAAPLTDWSNFAFYRLSEPLPCSHLATGFMLIHRSVFETLQGAYPELAYQDDYWGTIGAYYHPLLAGGRYLSEDYAFCERVRAQGIEIWLDPTLPLGHLGNYAYNGLGPQLRTAPGRQPGRCLIAPDWHQLADWGPALCNFLISRSPSEIYLYGDPVAFPDAEEQLGDLLFSAGVPLEKIWLDDRPAWELENLFASCTFWNPALSAPQFQPLAQRYGLLPLV
jgi:hypothetical protein